MRQGASGRFHRTVLPGVACVSGLAIAKGRVLLARRAHPPRRGEWSLPGGRVEPGDPPQGRHPSRNPRGNRAGGFARRPLRRGRRPFPRRPLPHPVLPAVRLERTLLPRRRRIPHGLDAAAPRRRSDQTAPDPEGHRPWRATDGAGASSGVTAAASSARLTTGPSPSPRPARATDQSTEDTAARSRESPPSARSGPPPPRPSRRATRTGRRRRCSARRNPGGRPDRTGPLPDGNSGDS